MHKGRFAPSPTGRMHLGNLFSALLSWLSAKSKGGQWLLRIEDIDMQRSRPEFAQLLMDDLQWLGLPWDGQLVYQSQRTVLYQQHFEALQAQGLTYPCYCSRADLLAAQAPHDGDNRTVYAGTCRHREPLPNQPAATRLIVPNQTIAFTDGHYGSHSVNLAHDVGDFIIRRKDGAWAYQLAVVIDDALMGITEVVRGCDLLLSSPQQMYVAQILGYTPPQFIHLPLLRNNAGQRLSKRDQSLDMATLRQQHSAQAIVGYLAYLAKLQPNPSPTTPQALLSTFNWAKVPTADITVADNIESIGA